MDKEYLLVLDFEANCTDKNTKDHEICEFPAVLLNREGVNIDEFRTFVKSVRIPKISEFIYNLTGITDEDIESGVEWIDALAMFDIWCRKNNIHSGNTIVVSCGDWDLKTMYPRQLALTNTINIQSKRVKELFSVWRNIKVIFCVYICTTKKLGMDMMMERIGIPLIGRHHSGIDDCRNIGSICKHLIENGYLEKILYGVSESFCENKILN